MPSIHYPTCDENCTHSKFGGIVIPYHKGKLLKENNSLPPAANSFLKIIVPILKRDAIIIQ